MTRRERLMATLLGRPVDRPAVNFYEIGSWANPDDPDPFNVYNDPSWRPLVQLCREQTDLISMCCPRMTPAPDSVWDKFFKSETFMRDGSRFTRMTLTVAGRTMTTLSRRDPGVFTTWKLEHLLKDADDSRAYLELPDEAFAAVSDVACMLEEEQRLGDSGIVMVDTADPMCEAASLFSLADYTVLAMTEPALFHRLLAQAARRLHARTEEVARALPGRLWRIYGPEFATPPFLPPTLFREYVVRYTEPMVRSIKAHGGFARIHCHGRIRDVLPDIVAMGADAIDPIEPPHQGDVELADVRRQYGKDLVLFGNLEASDIENMPPAQFETVVARSLRDGTAGQGRGFVLMASASPYGRTITDTTLANYRTMVRLACGFQG